MSHYNEGSSESLVIAEGKPQLEINSSGEKPKNEDDLFDLSKDQASFSLQIEDARKSNQIRQIYRQSKDDTLVFNVVEAPPEENKKRRREIFDKYRHRDKDSMNQG